MKYFLGIVIFLLSLIIFSILDYGRITFVFAELIEPFIFSVVLFLVFLNRKLLNYILWFSWILFLFMVFFYSIDFLIGAYWAGSLGTGILVILIFIYFPKLIKDGHI